MPETISTPSGPASIPAFVRWHGTYLDAILRADTPEAWEAAALAARLLIADVGEDGEPILRPGNGVNIDVLGPVILTPGVYDPETLNVITPPVIDARHHINVRLAPEARETIHEESGWPLWQLVIVRWMGEGTPDLPNAEEIGLALDGVTLIDPDTIRSASRVWA